MKYSIIIPYRNRQEHLEILLPRLQEVFKDKDYEIVVSEQNNSDNFRIACVENVGFQVCTGDIIILQQVDYYPTDDVSYDIDDQPVLPSKKGIFVNNDLTLREDIPSGYKRWAIEIDPEFYGGVVILRKEMWDKINGLNPLYKGWGNEDEDLRERFVWAGIPVKRNEIGTFLCLYHEDNGDMSKKKIEHQQDFYEGRKYFYEKAYNDRNIGYKNLIADIEEFDCGIKNVKWIKSTNYKIS